MLRILLLLFLPLCSAAVAAQSLYHIRVGTFQDVKADDFVDLRELGFVYGQPREGQLTDVYLGNYTTREGAETITKQLQQRGFRNAAVAEIPPASAGTSTYIQVALRSRNRSLDWRALEQAGKLYVDATDGVTKVLAGPYPTTEAANKALSDIRGLGYTDAFIRSVPSGILIPVGTFETGIKKPLIPIELRQVTPPAPAAAPPKTTPAEASTGTSVPAAEPATPAPAEKTPEPAKPSPAAEPTGGSVPAKAGAALPAIDGKTKRHSAAQLQRVLKEKGFYDGSIDGYYGPGTMAAYQKAWNEMEALRKYRTLADVHGNDSLALNWPELRVVTTIARELAAGQQDAEGSKQSASVRAPLLAAERPLATPAATKARNWESGVWEKLNAWADEDPLHARIVGALKVAYYQSQVRLEAQYQERGLGPIEARNLATAALENLLGPDLQRFR